MAFIESKLFVTRKQFEDRNEELRREAVEDFKSSMISSDTRLEDKLNEVLLKNFKKTFDVNEERRERVFNQMVENICSDLMEVLNKELINNQFIDSLVLEDMLKTERKKAFDVFHKSIEGEDSKLFDKHLFEVRFIIDCCEKITYPFFS